MKKENRELKKEQERQQEEKFFKKQGNICMIVILASAAVMLVVGQQNPGASWLRPFYGVMLAVVGASFVLSIRNVARHLRFVREHEED